jgi:hypothetical protein
LTEAGGFIETARYMDDLFSYFKNTASISEYFQSAEGKSVTKKPSDEFWKVMAVEAVALYTEG